MIYLLEQMGITFDDDNNTVLSKQKLLSLVKHLHSLASEMDALPSTCYVLVDHNNTDFYALPDNERDEWEKDGSCEQGDRLYRMELVKRY